MRCIRERLANEQGSALLLVMFAVVFLGLLFGGLFVAVKANTQDVLTHKLQVQAEYDAQKMMDWALHYYYLDNGKGKQLLAELDEDGCLRDEVDTDNEDKVCLIEDENTPKTLVATGTDSTSNGELKQTSVIKFSLAPSQGTVCDNGEAFFQRALSLNSDFDLTRARTGQDLSVQIDGGLYLHNQGKILLPGDPATETLSVPVNIGGYVTGDLEWVKDPQALSPQYDLLGDSAQADTTCSPNSEWSEYLITLANQVADTTQKVDVYKFTGDYLYEESTGSKKAAGDEDNDFEETEDTLSGVLADKKPKIVLMEGNVILGTQPTTNGWLIVYPKSPEEEAHIYLPDGFTWEHRGAITADHIGRYTADEYTTEWPKQYHLSIRFSPDQQGLYDQN